jgi:hypothetical protein
MNEIEKGYIAGIIDGEGSVCLVKTAGYRTPSVIVASNDLEILNFLSDLIGKNPRLKRKESGSHKAQYQWEVRGKRAILLLKEIEHFLLSPKKKARARLIVSKYEEVTNPGGNYTAETKLRKEEFERDFFAL